MNDTNDPQVEAAAIYTPPPFPTWPPPSGGAPVTAPELGPITNPYPYGTTQPANISTAPPSPPAGWPPPVGGRPGTFYPAKMPTGANGQNQAPPTGWPAWPFSRLSSGSVRACTLPDKASPSVSQIQPPPSMGPGR